MSPRLRFLVAGGGTGGHVTPALALAEELRDAGAEVRLLGSERGLEGRLVPAEGFELVRLPSRQFVGKSPLGRLRTLAALAGTTRSALRVLRRYRPHLVVSVGGYAAAPAVTACVLGRWPLALVEPNAIPGRVHRHAARFAARIFVAPGTDTARFGPVSAKVRPLGTPLRRALRDAFRNAPARRRPVPPFRLLVFGGSQGARQLNQTLGAALAHLADVPFEVFHQTGEADREAVAEGYAAAGVTARVVAFEPDMPARYAWADLALCRAGALTTAELALAGLPAVLVPLASAADDHQSENARVLERADAAWRLDPRRLDAKELADTLRAAFSDPERLAHMGRAAAVLARPDAAAAIAAECRALAGGGG